MREFNLLEDRRRLKLLESQQQGPAVRRGIGVGHQVTDLTTGGSV
jgi:hypothetical protein